jgi:protein disulfide-isomerase
MKSLLLLGIFLAGALVAQSALKVGDTYATVIAEKGEPGGKMNARGMLLMVYPEMTIKLKEGKVVAIDVPKDAVVAPEAPADQPPEKGGRFKPAIWTTNYEDALKQAKQQNRHVFVFFTGSDWCGWCMRLKGEILSTAEFQQYAREKLILVELDFPRKKTLPAPLAEQNARLARSFDIEGYPTVVVLNSRGKKIDELGYQAGGPGPFIDRLRDL